MKETELYEPIKKLLESQGFKVKGEVKNCDIAALHEDELWIVEMKLNLNMTLLYQAMSRLLVTPHVLVAIPRPKRIDKNFKIAQRILKKLELGLITVALDSPLKFAEIALLPSSSEKKRQTKKANLIRKEIEGRIGDNPGGSTRTPITTAYRELCIKIACMLQQNESLYIKEIPDAGAGSALQRNIYGWFTRISRGKYALSDKGKQYLKENSKNHIIQEYQKIVFTSKTCYNLQQETERDLSEL